MTTSPIRRHRNAEGDGSRSYLLRDLRLKMGELAQLLEDLESAADTELESASELHQRLADSESDRALLAERLVEVETQASRLMKLYVITYQLHATLELQEVYAAIGEIAVDLLGAARFALLMRGESSRGYRVVLERGLGQGAPPAFADGRYEAGEPVIDRALEDGHLVVDPFEDSAVEAVVPFTIQGTTVGALVVFELVAHRRRPLDDDRELLDLLAAHAASALLVANVHSVTHRKLNTLENLLSLVGEP